MASYLLQQYASQQFYLDRLFVDVFDAATHQMVFEHLCHKCCQEHIAWLFYFNITGHIFLLDVQSYFLQDLYSIFNRHLEI